MKKLVSSLLLALAMAATARADYSVHQYSTYQYGFNLPDGESGQGFYVGLQGGFNFDQSTVEDSIGSVDVTSDTGLGGFGGLKLGYATKSICSTVRPAFEVDAFYNGFSQDLTFSEANLRANGDLKVNSGAFLANAILRFPLSAVQPYIGVGAGFYTADESASLGLLDASTTHSGFAWQVIAGADYYMTSNISIFTEFKFLNYENFDGRLGQLLAGGGVRFHF